MYKFKMEMVREVLVDMLEYLLHIHMNDVYMYVEKTESIFGEETRIMLLTDFYQLGVDITDPDCEGEVAVNIEELLTELKTDNHRMVTLASTDGKLLSVGDKTIPTTNKRINGRIIWGDGFEGE